MVAANADFPLDFLIIRQDVLITDWPIGQRTAGGNAIDAGHAEVLWHKSPGLPGIHAGAAAQTSGVVLIAALVRANHAAVVAAARIAFNIGPSVVSIMRQPLIAEVVAAHILKGQRRAAFQQQDGFSGLGQRRRRHAAPSARPDHNRVVIAHPRTSNPIISQAMPFLLPPLPESL